MKDHFPQIYRYICLLTIFVLIYVAAITFLPIPKENQRFVDIALAFLLGLLAGNSNYLTGGNPSKRPEATQEIEKAGTVNLNTDAPAGDSAA